MRFTPCWALPWRAGALSLGEGGVSKAISSGAALTVLLDAGASENTKKKFRDSCTFYKVPLFETEQDRLGYAIGKPGRMSAAVAGERWARSCFLWRGKRLTAKTPIREDNDSDAELRGCEGRMSKMKVQDATKELSRRAAKLLGT